MSGPTHECLCVRLQLHLVIIPPVLCPYIRYHLRGSGSNIPDPEACDATDQDKPITKKKHARRWREPRSTHVPMCQLSQIQKEAINLKSLICKVCKTPLRSHRSIRSTAPSRAVRVMRESSCWNENGGTLTGNLRYQEVKLGWKIKTSGDPYRHTLGGGGGKIILLLPLNFYWGRLPTASLNFL